MQQDKPSRTAWAVALRRAVHQLIDRPLVLDDPLAVPIVGDAATREALTRGEGASGGRGGDVRAEFSRVMRAIVAGRSRYAEDQLAAAVAAGVRQYVVLGAGLDTFAHRNIHASAGLRVFEVDHPATQSWKRELLAAADIPAAAPDTLTFVPVDFETQTLDARLGAAAAGGFDLAAPAFFSWLGVVPYLTMPAFLHTLAFLGRRPAGTHVVFDYAIGLEELSQRERLAFDLLAQRVAAAGEPFQLFVPMAQMHALLRAAGFMQIEDLTAAQMNDRYFAGRADGLQVKGNLGHFLHAQK
jgi:methyltransferase (TIGR00027 family)